MIMVELINLAVGVLLRENSILLILGWLCLVYSFIFYALVGLKLISLPLFV